MATRKPIRWLTEARGVPNPPFGDEARQAIGTFLRILQEGGRVTGPASKMMPVIGARVHELRVTDREANAHWRIVYRTDPDAIVVVSYYDKNTQEMPPREITLAQKRLREYDDE